tara:strand:+ start:134 stop:1228 length:1095 start_codon:yes stop_codon:yes gene_type:complete
MISNKELIEIYNLSIKDFSKNEKSIIWKKMHHDKVFNNENNLINFRKNQILSEGTDDSKNISSTNKFKMIELLEDFDGVFLKKNLPVKNIGNCESTFNFLGFYFDYGIFHHLKWFNEISEIVLKKTKTICEIGGGYGSLARIILNNCSSKYILIDLPETNLLSSFYLKEHFPEKKFYLYKNYLENPSLSNLEDYDIFILPPWCNIDESIKIDFFINARSMQEMDKNIIKKYFNLIQRNVSNNGFFLNINRYYKLVDKEYICMHEYPYDNKWDVIISKPSHRQHHVHFLLTQRKNENFKNNIKNEIKKIKTIHDKKRKKRSWEEKFKISEIKSLTYTISKKILLLLFSEKTLKRIAVILNGMTKS